MTTLWPLALFCFVCSITPGPNNLLLTTSGLRFGFARTVPHILGISVGFNTLLAICAVGVGELVAQSPGSLLALKLGGSAYLLYLAWQLRALAAGGEASVGTPWSFATAWLFQFCNPKGWVMAVTSSAAFLPEGQPAALAVGTLCAVSGAIGLLCMSLWAGAGAALREHLREPRWRRLFAGSMVLGTVYAALAIW